MLSSPSSSTRIESVLLSYILLLSLLLVSLLPSQSQSQDLPSFTPSIPSHQPSAIRLSRRGLENAQRAGLAANSLKRPTSTRDLDLSDIALISTVEGSLHGIDRNNGKVLWNLDPRTSEGGGFEPLVGSTYGEKSQFTSFAELIQRQEGDGSLKELHQSGIYLIEPSSMGEVHVLTTETQDANGAPSNRIPKIEKLPLTLPQLVELSPFSFPGESNRVFVGKKKAKLVEIDAKTGKIGAVFGGDEGVWCGDAKDENCSGNDGNGEKTEDQEEPNWAYVGRTDYTLTIHVRSRPHLTQTLRFSTYTPNAADQDVAELWAQSGKHVDGRALLSAPEQGSILCVDTSDESSKKSSQDRTLWSTELNGTVAGIFDIVRPSSNLFSTTPNEPAGSHSNSQSSRPVIVPHPPLSRRDLLSYFESRSNSGNDPGSETGEEISEYEYVPQTYLGISDGHLFVMGSAKFPLVTFTSPAVAGLEAGHEATGHGKGRGIEGGNSKHQHSGRNCRSYGCWIGSYPAQYDPEDHFSGGPILGSPQLGIEDGGKKPVLESGHEGEGGRSNDSNQDPNDQDDSERTERNWNLKRSAPMVIFLQLVGIMIVLGIGGAIYLGLEEQKKTTERMGNGIANQVIWVPALKEDEAGFSGSGNNSDPNSNNDSNSGSNFSSYQDPLVISQGRPNPFGTPKISYSNPSNGTTNPLHQRHGRKSSNSNPIRNPYPQQQQPRVPSPPPIDPEVAAASAEAARAELMAEEEAKEKAEKAAAKKRESKRRRRGKRAGAAVQAKNGKESSNGNEEDEDEDGEDGKRTQVDIVKDSVLRKEDREGMNGDSIFGNSKQNGEPNLEISGGGKAKLEIVPPTPTTAALIDRGWLDPGSATNQRANPHESLSRRGSSTLDVDPSSLPRKGSALRLSSEVLGYGSSGTVVFKGTFQGRAVAVKRLLRDFVNVASKEVSLLESADNHPNVIRYFCKELTGSFLFIALELCPASLADVIEKPIEFRELGNKLDPKKALAQITSGLQHLHRLSIVHRDIKPQNILVSLSTGGNLKMLLSDFGLSKRLDGLAQTSFSQTMANPGGTVGWRAPEILRGDVSLDLGEDSESSGISSEAGADGTEKEKGEEKRRLTRAVDVFALGCLAYYVLSNGEHPFGSRYEREMNIIRRQIDLGRLDGLGEEGHEAQHLISAMISADPRQRPSATEVLLHPYFWDSNKRLTFLQDASDRFECMERDPPHPALVALELDAHLVVGPDWFKKVDKVFIDDLGKFRGYEGKSLQDLLRALRNKKHHYQDMAPLLKKVMGSLPDGFLSYFTRRFPLLFLRVYNVISEQALIKTETQFMPYFMASESDH